VKTAPAKRTLPGRRLAILRLGRGVLQMSASAFALGLLFAEGVTARALSVAVVACVLTMISVMLFGRGSRTT
jgi:hypothetical protein